MPNLQDWWSWCETQLLHLHFMVAWSIEANVPRSTVVCIDLQAHHVSVHIHTRQTQTHIQIDHSSQSPQFSFHIKRKLLIKPYIWNTHLHMFSTLWWVVFLYNRQNVVSSLNGISSLRSVCSCLFDMECCLGCAFWQRGSFWWPLNSRKTFPALIWWLVGGRVGLDCFRASQHIICHR